MKDLDLSPNPFFIKIARNIRKNLEVLKIMLIFANVLPFITEYCDTEHIVKLAFAIYSKTSKSLVAEGFSNRIKSRCSLYVDVWFVCY